MVPQAVTHNRFDLLKIVWGEKNSHWVQESELQGELTHTGLGYHES